jgi:hypothetical protein
MMVAQNYKTIQQVGLLRDVRCKLAMGLPVAGGGIFLMHGLRELGARFGMRPRGAPVAAIITHVPALAVFLETVCGKCEIERYR